MTGDKIDIYRDTTRFIINSRERFVAFMRQNYGMNRDDALDNFQDSCYEMCANIKSGHLREFTCSAFTYLLKIGINKANKQYRNNITLEYLDNRLSQLETELQSSDDEEESHNLRTNLVRQAVEEASTSRCRDILWGVYRDKMSMEQLAMTMNYKNADTVKATKLRCMSNLKKHIVRLFKENGLI